MRARLALVETGQVEARQIGAAVIAVYTRDIAETKASEANELARQEGHPLQLTTEPEE